MKENLGLRTPHMLPGLAGARSSVQVDIVERLQREGKDAFTKQYSLGMWKLCEEAANEILRLRAALKAAGVADNNRDAHTQDTTGIVP
jgi:hypothetical protein